MAENHSSADDSAKKLRLPDSSVTLLGDAFKDPGNSHFKNFDLIYQWLQFRAIGFRKHSIMWDFVHNPRSYGITGLPDLVLHDGYEPEKIRFKRLVFVEFEDAVKSVEKIKKKINETPLHPR